MKQKPWEATIPKQPKNRVLKRCYTVWTKYNHRFPTTGRGWRAGGKVVWLTNKQLTFYTIKYPNKTFEEVLDKDTKELYKQYLHQTVD